MREVECFFSKKARNFYFFGKKLLGRIVFVFIFRCTIQVHTVIGKSKRDKVLLMRKDLRNMSND